MTFQPFGYFGSPWREMERLRREMNRLFNGILSGVEYAPAPGYPALNVWANADGAIVTAELPGVKPEEIDVTAVGDTMTLTGNRQPDELPEGGTYHRRERGHGAFSRVLRLPFQIETDQVEAVFNKGVLRITLPRAEADKPKKITVKAA